MPFRAPWEEGKVKSSVDLIATGYLSYEKEVKKDAHSLRCGRNANEIIMKCHHTYRMPKSRIVMHQILARMWSDGAAHPLLVKMTQSSHFVRQSVGSLATTHSHPRTQNWAPWPCPNELKTYLHTTAHSRHLQQLYGEFPKLGCHKDTLQLVNRQTVVNLDNCVLSAVKRNRQTMKRCRRISNAHSKVEKPIWNVYIL